MWLNHLCSCNILCVNHLSYLGGGWCGVGWSSELGNTVDIDGWWGGQDLLSWKEMPRAFLYSITRQHLNFHVLSKSSW